MKLRHHADGAHGLQPGLIGDMNCTSCIKEQKEGKDPLITDGARMPKDVDWFCVWIRSDGHINASAGMAPPPELPERHGIKWTFTVLLTTNDWEAARMAIRAWRTASVMNMDLWPLEKSAESNLLGVLI